MTRAQRFFAAIQDLLAKSRIITLIAIKIRNQCNQIIVRRLSIRDMSPHLNGEHLLLDHLIPLCNNYFDVGANKGDWTSYILDSKTESQPEIFLYEPGLTAYQISLNRFKGLDNIKIYNCAMSDHVGQLEFYEQENAGELSSAIKKWVDGPFTIIQVDTTTVDSELSKLKIDYLDFAKIDTEGFDLYVLKGALNSIGNKRIGFIQFEYNRVWAMSGSTLLSAYEIFEENGYKVFLIKPDGLYDYDVRKYGEFYAFSNFIAISPEKLPHLKKLIKGAA